MSEEILLHGFGLRGYRSFGSDVQRFGPLKRMNVIVGKNNCGKSNVLRFLRERLPPAIEALSSRKHVTFDADDRPRGSSREGVVLALAAPVDSKMAGVTENLMRRQADMVEKILTSRTVGQEKLFWTEYECDTTGGTLSINSEIVEKIHSENVLSNREWEEVCRKLTRQAGGGIEKQVIPNTLEFLGAAKNDSSLDVSFIPAIREIDKPGESTPAAGKELSTRLARMQHPDRGERDQQESFERLNDFVRRVTGEPKAELEITFPSNEILVRMHGRELPLRDLGSGIQEVVILAATATATSNTLVCMEEPEVHLHPTLQRRLVQYLLENTDNQYILATHSAHFIDLDEVAVLHLRLEDGWSTVDQAVTGQDRFQAAHDLGYRASDLLQSNCIIWVEGPSDRIYLNHWLRAVAPDLVEGVHYSIMFYGGSLRSHLSASEDGDETGAVDDFISLQKLNRNVAFLMDSDQSEKGERRDSTKLRIEREIQDLGGFVWSTEGREIENYIPPEIMLRAIQDLDSSARELVAKSQYDRAYVYNRGAEKQHTPPKVELAHAVEQYDASLELLDLRSMMEELTEFIGQANRGLEG